MTQATPIPPRLADLFRLCLEHVWTFNDPEDPALDTNLGIGIPPEICATVQAGLAEYSFIELYVAPKLGPDDPVHSLVVGFRVKDCQWYQLTSDLPRGDYATCMTLLREAANERRRPFGFFKEGRSWTIAAGVLYAVTVLFLTFSLTQADLSKGAELLSIIGVVAGFVGSIALLMMPKILWDGRAAKIDELVDAIPA